MGRMLLKVVIGKESMMAPSTFSFWFRGHGT